MDLDQRIKRLRLHSILLGITPHVYFQPPTNISMQYPCIRYKRDLADTEFADNSPYRYTQRYQVTVIDRNPDSDIPGKVAALPLCKYSQSYQAEDLNHDVYNIFF